MNEKDWQLIVTLSEEKSLTRTAQKLFLSQPAVSLRIQALENELNCQLVIRGRRITQLTSEGELLARYARHQLDQLGSLREDISSRNGIPCGVLRIASSHAYALHNLSRLLRDFSAMYPRIEISVASGNSQVTTRLLESGQVHVGIIRRQYNWSEESILLRSDPFYYLLSAVPIDLKELPNLPQIHPVHDSQLQEILDQWWISHYKQPPRIAFVVDRWDICVELVRQGLGYTILSGLYTQDLKDLYQERLVLSTDKTLLRCAVACCRSISLKNSAVKAFWDYLNQCPYTETARK